MNDPINHVTPVTRAAAQAIAQINSALRFADKEPLSDTHEAAVLAYACALHEDKGVKGTAQTLLEQLSSVFDNDEHKTKVVFDHAQQTMVSTLQQTFSPRDGWDRS